MLETFQNVFNDGGIKLFSNFLNEFTTTQNWSIFSDYYFEDKRESFVIAISIIPNFEELGHLRKIYYKLFKSDIKHTRDVSIESLKKIKTENIFTISIILPKIKYYPMLTHSVFKENMKKTCNDLINIRIPDWKIRQPHLMTEHISLEKKIYRLLTELEKGTKLLSIWRMWLVSVFIGYVISLLVSNLKIKKIGWFSDRDAINDLYNYLSKDFVSIFVSGLARKTDFELIIGDARCTAETWFDEILRVSDYIAGALSDFNFENRISSKEKFQKVVSHYLSNNEKSLIYRFTAKNTDFRCMRVQF